MRIAKFTLALLLMASVCFADGITAMSEGAHIMYTQELTLAANVAGKALNAELAGGYIFDIEATSIGDDAFTITVKSDWGNTLFTGTWSSATSDEEPKQPSAYHVIVKNTIPTITVTDFSGTQLKIRVTVIKK